MMHKPLSRRHCLLLYLLVEGQTPEPHLITSKRPVIC
jgi:hypothetical protein